MKKPPKNFEDAMRELEELAAQMESGDMPIEKMMEAYARGAQLVEYGRKILEDARQKISVFEKGALRDASRLAGETRRGEDED